MSRSSQVEARCAEGARRARDGSESFVIKGDGMHSARASFALAFSARAVIAVAVAMLSLFAASAQAQPTAGTPIVAPQTPPANGSGGNCATDADCLAAANTVRAAQEGLPPLVLPSNWTTLTAPEQMFVDTNMERVSRGLPAIANLVNTYDGEVQTGMATDNDPNLVEQVGWDSIWAGGNQTVLGAMYGWLYDDGVGSGNLDCNSPTDPGCWGHRNAILDNAGASIAPNEMDAIVGTDNSGQPSYAAALVQNPNPTPAANIVFTWAQEQQFLAAPTLGGVAPTGPTPHLARLHLSASSFTALSGLKEPAVIIEASGAQRSGTEVSYTDSIRADTTFTIAMAVKTGSKTRYEKIGEFIHTDGKGANRFRFTGRLNGAQLRPGNYRMTLSPRSGTGKTGASVSVTFTIKR